MSETNRRRLFELLKKPGNDICADCDLQDPEWASITIGVFLCTHCASIHRNLGSHISRAKSIKFDNWDQSQVVTMEENGNISAKALYEKFVPRYYKKPDFGDPKVVKEQWIRAKYERKEFMTPTDTVYNKGYLEGCLYKRGKKEGKFHLRKFVLSQVEGTLKYFVKETHKSAKAVISISHLNATFCPEKIGNPNGLQITYLKDGYTRSIFVYTEDGKDIIDWYTAIRAAKLNHLQIAFPTTPSDELKHYLTRDFLMEGFLWKTGPRVGDSYKKRYFVLDDRKLMYLENPMDAYPKGEIFLGEKSEGFAVRLGIPPGLREHQYGCTLRTPERTWLLGAESEEERDAWIAVIESVMDRPPQLQAVALRNDLRNSYSYKKTRGSTSNVRSSGGSFTGTLRKGKNFFSFS